MIEAVFISDLHLGPDTPEINNTFFKFCDYISTQTKTLYILGDFFHAWPGDDLNETWIHPIIEQLRQLNFKGVTVYLMHGNRDFLIGKNFCQQSLVTLIPEPYILTLGSERVALVHGDRYCSKDRKHQLFRRVTRNRLFTRIFLSLPFKFRQQLVGEVRRYSQNQKVQQQQLGQVVDRDMADHLCKLKLRSVIHGHTHQPAFHKYVHHHSVYLRYVLSDWDDRVMFLCYDKTIGFYFNHFIL